MVWLLKLIFEKNSFVEMFCGFVKVNFKYSYVVFWVFFCKYRVKFYLIYGKILIISDLKFVNV